MAKKTAPLLPATEALLQQFGDRLRLSRLRRRLQARQVAERAGMSPMTLRSLERGGSGVTMGAYLAVMQVLGIEKDLDLLGQIDSVGRSLQDARLRSVGTAADSRRPIERWPQAQVRKAMPSTPTVKLGKHKDKLDHSAGQPDKGLGAVKVADSWADEGGFVSADDLAKLIAPAPSGRKTRSRSR